MLGGLRQKEFIDYVLELQSNIIGSSYLLICLLLEP